MAVSLTRVVEATISRVGQGIPQQGFGTPGGLHQLTTGQQLTRYATYTTLADMVTAGIPTTSTAYEWAQAVSAQTPRPAKWAIGRRVPGVAQAETVTVVTADVGTWTLDEGGVPLYAFIASGADTEITIAIGLHAQIAADSVSQFTVGAVPVAANFVVTSKIAGEAFVLTIEEPGTGAGTVVNLTPNTVAEDVSDALDAVEAESKDFFRFTIDSRSNTDILEAALWASTRQYEKTFFAQTSDPLMRAAEAGTSIGSLLNALSYTNTTVMHHSSDGAYLDGGIVGKASGIDMDSIGGRINYALLQIIGVPVDDITSAQVDFIDDNHGNSYVFVTGAVPSTFNGKAVDDQFIDLYDVDSWFKARVQEAIGAFLLLSDVVAFDNSGIGGIKGQALSVALRGQDIGHFTSDVPVTVTAPTSAEVAPADKASRTLRDLEVTATYAGAINSVKLTATFSI